MARRDGTALADQRRQVRKTEKCQGCGRAIRAGSKTGRCCHCAPRFMGAGKAPKYPWNEAWDDALREAYAKAGGPGQGRGPGLAVDLMERVTGYPRHIISQRAGRLGLTRDLRRPWTVAEIARLRAMVDGDRPPRAVARGLGRSYESVVSRMDYERLSRKFGLTHAEVGRLLGVSSHMVARWVTAGSLASEGNRVRRRAVEDFFWEHLSLLDLRTMEHQWLREVLERAGAAMRGSVAEQKRRAA